MASLSQTSLEQLTSDNPSGHTSVPHHLPIRRAVSTIHIPGHRPLSSHRRCFSDIAMDIHNTVPPDTDKGPGQSPPNPRLSDDKSAFRGYQDALEPLGLSLVSSNGTTAQTNLSSDEEKLVRQHLWSEFGVKDFYVSGPFIVLLRDATGPAASRDTGQLPHLVGALCPLWRDIDEPDDEPMVFGEMGEGAEMMVDESVFAGWDYGKAPSNAIVEHLATYFFTECEAITWIAGCLVIELPKVDEASFEAQLSNMPLSIAYAPCAVQYHNGPFPTDEQRKRAVTPNPKPAASHDRTDDETDYVSMDGKFYPGSIIYSINDKQDRAMSCVSAGVLIRKGTSRRLTCSWHAWEDINKDNLGVFGQDTDEARHMFRVIQGTKPGTNIGYVKERVGETDIALIQLHDGITFENKFLDSGFSAKRLVHSSHTKAMELFHINGFPTGEQILTCLGTRCTMNRGKSLLTPGINAVLPQPGVAYVKCRQVAALAEDKALTRKPYIRDSVCGSVLLRSKVEGEKASEDTVMARGEVVAMCHLVNLTSGYNPRQLLMFADALDPLIEDGWTIVPLLGGIEEKNITRDGSEESPAKRLRTR